MGGSPAQLSLAIALRDDATFANFYTADTAGRQLVQALKRLARGEESASYILWGAEDCGLTHLMQAVCHEAGGAGLPVQYLPMEDFRAYRADEICQGLEHTAIVCVDGIDRICGCREWEIALFHLFNKLQDSAGTMVFGSHGYPASLPFALADLKSRILGCAVFHLRHLNDAEKEAALIMRAGFRGMQLAPAVAKFILRRASRSMGDLFDLLDRLDEASMQHQRKLTIPFVKDILAG